MRLPLLAFAIVVVLAPGFASAADVAEFRAPAHGMPCGLYIRSVESTPDITYAPQFARKSFIGACGRHRPYHSAVLRARY